MTDICLRRATPLLCLLSKQGCLLVTGGCILSQPLASRCGCLVGRPSKGPCWGTCGSWICRTSAGASLPFKEMHPNPDAPKWQLPWPAVSSASMGAPTTSKHQFALRISGACVILPCTTYTVHLDTRVPSLLLIEHCKPLILFIAFGARATRGFCICAHARHTHAVIAVLARVSKDASLRSPDPTALTCRDSSLAPLDDLWILDTHKAAWLRGDDGLGATSRLRPRNAAVLLPVRDHLVLHGGWLAFQESYNDTWLLDLNL